MKKNILKLAVIGAGTMGAAIAASGARAGLDVAVLELLGADKAADNMKKLVKKGEMKGAGAQRILAGVKCYDMETGGAALRDCDLVIEAVAEKLDIKRSTMKFVFENCGPDTIVGTNTSNISVSQIAEEFPEDWQQRFMGIHFFNPVRYMDLVELIPHSKMSSDKVDAVAQLINDSFGKSPIVCKDAPGFIANRIGSMALGGIINATQEFGYPIPLADALTGDLAFRPKQGAFKLLDLVGLDISMHTVEYLHTAPLPDYEKPYRNIPNMIVDIVGRGYLGNKTKGGFYKKEGKARLVWDYNTCEYVPLEKAKVASIAEIKGKGAQRKALLFGDLPESPFMRRVILEPIWLAFCAVDDISYSYKDIDVAMKGGYNWIKGPFEQCDELGCSEVIELMEANDLPVPAWVKEKIAADGKFYTEPAGASGQYMNIQNPAYPVIMENEGAAVRDIGDGIACLTLKTKANTFTVEAAEMIYQAAAEIEKNAAFKGMVIYNEGPNFGAGANLMDVAGAIKTNHFDMLDKSVEIFQKANMAVKYMKKPVVAAARGQALGGSGELLMHCDRVVAHQELYLGLVEMGVGLVPSGGGCAELLARASAGYEYGQAAGLIASIDKYVLSVAQATFSMGAENAVELGFLRESDVIVPKSDAILQRAKAECLNMAAFYKPPVKPSFVATGEFGYSHIGALIHTMKSGNMMTEYDAVIVEKLARIFSGGDALAGEKITEDDILLLERKAFIELAHNEKTLERITGMLTTGKAVRN